MRPNRDLKRVQNAIHRVVDKESLVKSVGAGFFTRQMLVSFSLPASIVVGAMTSMAVVDQFLFENPDFERKVIAEQQAYLDSVLDMSNPWGTLDADNPASFLMALLIGVDSSVMQKFRALLKQMDLRKITTFGGSLQHD